jgi:hypothetical protein
VPLATAEVDDALLAAWRALEQVAVEPNPFFAPEVLLPAVRHLRGGAGVALLVVERDGELDLAVPVRRERHRRMPLPAATTWRHAYRYVGTPLVRAPALHTAPAAALALLRTTSAWLVLDDLYLDGTVARAFCGAVGRTPGGWVVHEVWDRPVVHRHGSSAPTALRWRKTLRRLRRNLERDLSGVAVSCDSVRDGDRAGLAADVEAFLALESAGWKGRAGTAITSDPGHAAFFRAACERLADHGRLELWKLRVGERIVARQCNVRAGDTVFHLKTTYDEDLARYSPGVQLELDLLDAFYDDSRLTHLDSCTDPGPTTSSRLYPHRRRTGVALLGLRPQGRCAALLTPPAVAAWRWAAVRRR